jgi:penicillin amidase
VQDIYIERTRGTGAGEEFAAADGSWQPVLHLEEKIKVKHGLNETLEVRATRHGEAITPILTPLLAGETRQLALRWTIYDPATVRLPVEAIAKAGDWTSFLAAFAQFGGPTQNVVYADDQGHIGYHAMGRVPTRGEANRAARTELPADVAAPAEQGAAVVSPGAVSPTIVAVPDPLAGTAIKAPAQPAAAMLSGALSAVPVSPGGAHEWSGYIPFEQMPQVYDPPGGVIATANARVAADDFEYPITLNWAAPYRNERIWHLLQGRRGLTPADMLAIEMDVDSAFDKMLAERLAYGLDHSPALNGTGYAAEEAKRLHQAADLLRGFNGRMAVDSPAAALVAEAHGLLWPMLLGPHLRPGEDTTRSYVWHEKDYALEQVLMHAPPRWLPQAYANWDDFLAAVVARALEEGKAPGDLAKWRYGSFHTVDVEHPVFARSLLLRRLLGMRTGTGELPQSGDATTVKQVGHTFGPSERFTADLGDLDRSTLNLVLGESGNVASPWFMDQFAGWYAGRTFGLAFSDGAVGAAATHRLTLEP